MANHFFNQCGADGETQGARKEAGPAQSLAGNEAPWGLGRQGNRPPWPPSRCDVFPATANSPSLAALSLYRVLCSMSQSLSSSRKSR